MKIAFVGAGWVANRHLSKLAIESGIEIVGHVSPSSKELEIVTRRWGGRGYISVNDLLKNEKVDAAWITVPPDAHGEIELAFIKRGIPIFVEKPLSADRATGEMIGQRMNEKGIIGAVGYHWRAMDTIPGVRDYLAKNPARMVLAAWHDTTPPPVWWRHQQSSGGQIVEQATHLFDLTRYLMGEATVEEAIGNAKLRSEYPDSDIANVSAAMVKFSNCVPGVFSATCVLGNQVDVYVKFICEGTMISVTQMNVIFESSHQKIEKRVMNDPFLSEDLVFIEAINKNDPGLLFSSYEDALKTHSLCHDVLEKYWNKI